MYVCASITHPLFFSYPLLLKPLFSLFLFSYTHTSLGINSSANCIEYLIKGLCVCVQNIMRSTLKLWSHFSFFILKCSPHSTQLGMCGCFYACVRLSLWVCTHELEVRVLGRPVKTNAGSKEPMGAERQRTSPPSSW